MPWYTADELLKIATDTRIYRKIKGGLLDRQIPLVRSVPKGEDGRKKLLEAIENSTNTRWSHPQVAVKKMDLEKLRFEPTRLAVPLPGEAPGAKSWRSGELHAHKMGPVYLVHKDAVPPKSIYGSIEHVVKDAPPAVVRRFRGAVPPFIPKEVDSDK